MKTSFSSIDIAALVAEIRPKIVDSWINNIYSIGKNLVILRFRKSTESSFELVIESGKRFHLTKYQRKKPTTPNNKIISMRKHIRDLPVKDFYQLNLDRVIVFEIAFKAGFYKLVVELFGGGNIILVGPNGKIILAYKYRRMKDRDIHPGKEYFFPPYSEVNITNLTETEFLESLQDYKGKTVSLLNEIMGLGPLYSKEILLKTNISKKTADELEEEEKSRIFREIASLQNKINNQRFEPTRYLDEEEVIDITPIPISRYEDLVQENIESFNDELDDFFSVLEEEPESTEDKSEVSGKMKKVQKTLANQEKHLKSLKKQEIDEKKKGDLLYTHFTVIDELLTTILKARREGINWKEIEEKLQLGKERGIPSVEILDRIDPKNKLIWVKLEDAEEEIDAIVELDFTLSLTESANSFYEKAKKGRRKIPGAEQAIERTKKQLSEVETTQEKIVKEIETKPMLLKRPKRWYEKFHWFLCGEHIIIGGTDAKVNERILKTYLDDNDLFFHADVHGAPYVVVKDGQTNLSEECKNAIAVFALSFSSLWKGKKLVGDVFYVLPEQVSLTAPSGQYLAKGSVMIYGEKNYFKNVEIKHSIGVLLFDQYAQVIAGPSENIEARTELNVSIKPGSIPKGKIVKEIIGKLVKQCPEEEKHKIEALTVNDFLPFIPGDAEVL